MTDSVKILF